MKVEVRWLGILHGITGVTLVVIAYGLNGWRADVCGFGGGMLLKEGWDWWTGKNLYRDKR